MTSRRITYGAQRCGRAELCGGGGLECGLDPCGPSLTCSLGGGDPPCDGGGGPPGSPLTSGCGTAAFPVPPCSPATFTTPGCGVVTTAPDRDGPKTTCELGERTRTALAHCVGAGCCAGGTSFTQTRHMPPGGAYFGGIALEPSRWPIGAGGPYPRPPECWSLACPSLPLGATRTAVACADNCAEQMSNAQPAPTTKARRVPA